ncbi:hypothetical protein CYMTET_23300, partial [Cymbomonas tetramitiformis]
PPGCHNCTYVAGTNTAAYQTAEGAWATRAVGLWVNATQETEVGGFRLSHEIIVNVVDVAGATVVVDSISIVEPVNAADSPCSFSGDTFALQVTNGTARFSNLVLLGDPGSTCLLYFQSYLVQELSSSAGATTFTANEERSASTAVPLRYCERGEYLEAGSQKCIRCPSGTLSFSNSSSCVSCSEIQHPESISCLGGDAYAVCQGSWLAPNAQHCGTEEDPAECFLSRLYPCEVAAACTTGGEGSAGVCTAASDPGRAGQGLQDVEALALCNLVEFTEGVRCGGTIPVICSNGYYRSTLRDACLQCPSRAAIILTFVAIMAGLCALVVGAVYLSRTNSYRRLADVMGRTFVLDCDTRSNELHYVTAKNTIRLLIGYIQVFGQLTLIYPVGLVPFPMSSMSAGVKVFNFNLSFLLNIKCLTHHFSRVPSVGSYFWTDFWQSVALPPTLCLLFTLAYWCLVWRRERQRHRHWRMAMVAAETGEHNVERVQLQARSGHRLGFLIHDDTQASKCMPELAELQWRSDMWARCLSVGLFVMMFVHPGISTTLFQLFNCEEVAYNDRNLVTQHWLKEDASQECYTDRWYIAMVFAIITIAFFVVGFPVGLFVAMTYLRRFHKVRMPREVADRHVDQVHPRGALVPCAVEDVIVARLCNSFYLSRDNSSIETLTILGRMNTKRSIKLLQAAREDRGSGASWGTTNSGAGPSGGERASRTAPSESERGSARKVRGVTRHWRQRAAVRSLPPVEFYVPQDEFEWVVAREEASLNAGREKLLRKQPRGAAPANLRQRSRSKAADALESVKGRADAKPDRANAILLRNGQVIEDVTCLEKQELGGTGEIDGTSAAPVTKLDDRIHLQVLGQFWEEFEYRFYFWQCLEIVRRVAITGLVVVMSVQAGQSMSLIYGVLVSALALVVHQRYSPYINDALDDLQTNILINQLVIQVMLVMVQLHEYEDDEELIIGISLVLLQIALLMYTMSIIIHVWRVVMRPVFSDSPIPTWFADFRDRLARRDPSHKQETERNRATTELVEQPVLISNPFYSNEPEDPLEPVIEGPLPSTSLDNTGIPQSTPLELTDLPSKDQSHGIDDVCHEHAEIMDYSGATVIQKLKSVLESSEFDVSEGNSSNKETTVAGAPALCPDHS